METSECLLSNTARKATFRSETLLSGRSGSGLIGASGEFKPLNTKGHMALVMGGSEGT